jgi:hypothetical protein
MASPVVPSTSPSLMYERWGEGAVPPFRESAWHEQDGWRQSRVNRHRMGPSAEVSSSGLFIWRGQGWR